MDHADFKTLINRGSGAYAGPVAVSDFKNGVYSINGVTKNFGDLWIDGNLIVPDYYTIPVVVIPGVGIRVQTVDAIVSTADAMGVIPSPPLITAMGGSVVDGVEFEIDYILGSDAGPMTSNVGVTVTNSLASETNAWYYESSFREANAAYQAISVYDYIAATASATGQVEGFHHDEGYLGPDELRASSGVLSVSAVVTNPLNPLPDHWLAFSAGNYSGSGGGSATTILEKIVIK